LNDPRQSEVEAFSRLQKRMTNVFRDVFPDPLKPRTVLVVPSLTLDPDVLSKIAGAHHYEQRLLCLLMLLRLPATRVIYVTSQPIPETIIDYYLHLLPSVPHQHARARLTMVSCHDASSKPLTQKILDRPRLLQRVRDLLGKPEQAHMVCFSVSELERTLAVKLDIPIYGCDPALLPLGTKSGSRKLFRKAGILLPDGAEDLNNPDDIATALTELKRTSPGLRKAVVKLNEGFSGEGNATFLFDGAPEDGELSSWVRQRLPELCFEAKTMQWEEYAGKISQMGAIVEAFIEGEDKRSPSAQYRIDPTGKLEAISTHDQILDGQVFLGARFPADVAYRLAIQNEGLKAAALLKNEGVIGRFGIDFISVRDANAWRHYAIEVNLRKGGTTHPFIMLQFLTDGRYDPDTGTFRTPDGRTRCYYATDNLESEQFLGLTPDDLIEIAIRHGIHFHATRQSGVVFHLIGALSEFGKLGTVCVGESPSEAQHYYEETLRILTQAGQYREA
jgi:hypothetical protein